MCASYKEKFNLRFLINVWQTGLLELPVLMWKWIRLRICLRYTPSLCPSAGGGKSKGLHLGLRQIPIHQQALLLHLSFKDWWKGAN